MRVRERLSNQRSALEPVTEDGQVPFLQADAERRQASPMLDRGDSAMLPTFTGIGVYTEHEKFQKISFSDIEKNKAAHAKKRIVGLDLNEVSPGQGEIYEDVDTWDAIVGARLLYRLIGTALMTR